MTEPEIEEVTMTLYFVGENEQHAASGIAFDDPRDAEEYRHENDCAHVYEVVALMKVSDFQLSGEP